MDRVIIFCSALLLAACSTLSKSQCLTADWRRLGLESAKQGQPKTDFTKLAQACSEHGVEANQNRFDEGWAQGLQQLCSLQGGIVFGESGGHYKNTCPLGLEAEFLKGYQFGQEKRKLREREAALDTREREFNRSFRGQMIPAEVNTRLRCTFDSDCQIRGSCELKRCSNSGFYCTFDGDCTRQGLCRRDHCRF